MAVRSVDFLPEIFQTDANKQFLAATLDQLIQEPRFKTTQGFIGRTVGPGVNPNDRYVVEPTTTRSNYQLEPGVVSLKPDTNTVEDVVTYPGINDAIAYQGGNSTRPDRLYSSEYYTWDPFIDFDSFVNFSQYFWVQEGLDVVNVRAEAVPVTQNYVVTRNNGVYTFSGINGENPNIELVRGGSYTFQVSQNDKETVNYRVRNQGTTAYSIDGINNPTLTLVRGNTYVFNMNTNGSFPFWIKTLPVAGTGNPYNNGVSRNGSSTGLVTFTVPQDAPSTLYYVAENYVNMQGTFNIIDGQAGSGPGFWIQAAPGISGVLPVTPNISSRDVLGVENNGEDLGLVTFNVPYKTTQSFYYNLTNIGTVDMVTDLNFDQINNQPVADFIAQYNGIDGTRNLNGRTLIFNNAIDAPGWIRESFFDPLTPGNNGGVAGSYDSLPYSLEEEIPEEDKYQIWQINYVTFDNIEYINLSLVKQVNPLEKFNIVYGSTWSNTQWYKNQTGRFEQIPLLTAAQDVLYYQDGTDPEIFGRIKLIDQAGSDTIFIEDILGKKSYISPNGVTFSNGLKVKFTGNVEPSTYGSGVVGITYVQTESNTNYITAQELLSISPGQEIIFNSPTLGGIEAGKSYYIRSIAASGLKFTISETLGGPAYQLQNGTGAGATASLIVDRQYYVAGVGTGIKLLPAEDFVTPETYSQGFDYITIDRASLDLNPWTRSNRWFHIDVINATAEYNNTTVVLDNTYRAKRPIIQFRPNIRLWNFGTDGKAPVDIIDFSESDAFSNIEGSTGYTVDGYTFVEGTRVIFAADEDTDVRNKIYTVSFVTPDTIPPLIAQPIINLTLASDGEVLTDQNTVVKYGNTSAGKSYWYNGTEWKLAQQKTGIQQAPLYNVYDPQGVSFGDESKYQSTNFSGSKLFSYAVGDTNILDPILQFPLQYLNINNVGDIVFENNLYRDTFIYVVDNVSVTSDISSGSVREYLDRETYQKQLGWQTAIVDSQIYQQFKFSYQYNTPLQLDVEVLSQSTIAVPVIKIYINSEFQEPSTYTYSLQNGGTTISLNKTFVDGDIIEVLALSNQTSQVAFYQVPINLESNPLNANSSSFTLGTIRTHYQSICENLTTLSGPISGANNTRDLGNIIPYGLVILQQSAPLTLAGYFLRSKDYNIFDSLIYNSREYIKYKAQLMDAVIQQNIQFQTAAQILDTAIQDVTLGRVESQPFYWSDMLPSGVTVASNTYTVSFVSTGIFDTVQVYNYESANYLGLNVYLNDVILTRGSDYVVATDGPRVTIITPLTPGDKVTINEYNATYGSYIPNTPTKLGLFPAWEPELITNVSSTGEVQGIRGHDGSFTPLFGDIRDDVLFEFETRIYNNLKLDGNPVPLTVYDVLPGQFRDTGYEFEEINKILGNDFLSYCGWNKLDYKTQQYQETNEFTYNYSSAQNRLTGENLLGAWRGIYRYFYDTEQPSLTPWEMLGFTIKPTWWDTQYGTAPYTQDNLVLWDDLEAGYVRDPIAPYYLPEFARPGLTKVIPTGDEGELLSPLNSVTGTYNPTQFQKSWTIGDGGPVEASWWNSSGYPFAVMHVLAVTRPAKFFALFADRDLYKYNVDYDQYLYNNRYRLDANGIEVYGNGVSKASYINWIVDYNRVTGINSTTELSADLKSLDVRLCYRMASFSDKQYIELYTEKSSPNSTNTALQIPSESYDILLYKNQPFDRSIYSSVAIQKTASGGYAVFGYSTTQPYFNILQSKATGRLQTYSSSGITIRVPTFYTDNVISVPYGFVFDSITSVADFLLSYGKFLESQGFSFTNIANGYVLDWPRMVQEFMYWSQQGWDTDAIINLNPLASGLTVERTQAIVDTLKTQTSENSILTENGQQFPTRNLNIVRLGNTFKIEPLSTQSISYVDINFTNYEHIIVLNNQSVFGDLIYDPTTGARQSRLSIKAVTSADWNGSVDAPGFIINQNNVEEWTGLRTYSKGEIVKYKNVYWSALTIVQPSSTFNFNDWTQSDYSQLELGLLPNIANKADQLANSYNINNANIESDNDLLSYGLIGFRPRQYMAALNLDDVSQLNIYRQFLDTKGTVLAAELFKGANLGKETADYDIYENWAVQRAVYGANANRSYVELRLDRALLNSNPSIVQVIQPTQESEADQTILFSDIWKQSYKLTSAEFLPTTTEVPTDTALPSAGYVSLNDADLTVFDITDTDSLSQNLDSIEVGTSIWVAKTNDYDWNIYRAEAVPGIILHVCDNLNGTSRVIFSQQHGLTAGDKLIIKFFDIEVNGVYQVLSVADLNTVNIAFQFAGDRTVADGQGLGFTLQTMRVAQPSDIVNLPYSNDLTPGAKVWVDDNGAGKWQVLEKQQVFVDATVIAPKSLNATEQYGSSVAQSRNRLTTLVGSPRYGFETGTETGGVYLYVKTTSADFTPVSPLGEEDAILTLGSTGVRNYGASVDFGNTTWAVAGAPGSLGPASQADVGYAAVIYRDPVLGQPGVIPYAQWQLLTPDEVADRSLPGEFGYSVAMSLDERWMYIGAPGVNKVYAYGRVDWQNQFVRARGDGVTSRYYIDSTIQIDAPTQLKVTVDGLVLTLNTDYTVHLQGSVYDYVEFTTPPAADKLIDIQRIYVTQLDANTYYEVPQTSTSGSGLGAEFTIIRVRGEVGQPGTTQGSVGATSNGSGYAPGDTITIAGASFGSTNNIVLTVNTVTAGGALNTFTIAYTPPALATTFSLNETLFTATNIYAFSVTANGNLLRPYIDYSFNETTKDLTLIGSPAPSGTILLVNAQGYYRFVDTITVAGLTSGARFGHSVSCSTDGRQVLIGAPNQTVNGKLEAGAVYSFDRNTQRFIYNESSSDTFTVLGTVTAPISVTVNNQLLINEDDAVVGATNSFAWNGSNTVTINATLNVGDIIEIETNQFELIEEIDQNSTAEFSNFGYAIDLCSYNCSLYVGEPNSSSQVFKGGMVERSVNQSRIYGTTTSSAANPVLTSGNTLRVNNQDVVVPAAWNNSLTYNKNDVVYYTSGSTTTIYRALQQVPALTLISNTSYWIAVDATGTISSVPVKALAAQINATVPNVVASVGATGLLTIATKNVESADPFNKLQVLPGSVGTAFATLGFDTYVWTQDIVSPYPVEYAGFGSSLSIDDSAVNLVVGSPKGTLYLITVFDEDTTIFDVGSTVFFTSIANSGSVYTYNYLPSSTSSVSNPGMFVLGDQVATPNIKYLDQYGIAVSYVDGILLVGAPSYDFGDSSASNYGSVFIFENTNRTPSWNVITEEQPTVDIRLLNGVFLYDRISSTTTEFLDFINPLQGKVLGAARQNIDYIGAIDPASYNIGPNNIRGTTWGAGNVGEIWWDTTNARFIDPAQDDITYAARRWSQLFPGSTVDVYQWVVSPTPPDTYVGEGTPRDTLSYTINSRLNNDGTIGTEYYFWVRGITVTATKKGKTLPPVTIANYISNPRESGIPYIAPINGSTVALYNCNSLIEASDTILNIEFDREYTNNNVHVEYELIPQDRSDGFLSGNLYRKLQDSFCGSDTAGNLVPDSNLTLAERYGVQFRPRQSMFVNRFDALKNYLSRANSVLAQYPISESRTFNLLNSSEPEPTASSGEWNLRVANLEILGFQNLYAVPLGYKYLVVSDSSNRGLWTIYTVAENETVLGARSLVLTKVQNYNTPDYWDYIDWYRPGYNSSVKIITEVANFSNLATLNVPIGSSVKVTANAQGKWEIYLLEDTGWARVGLQSGTIEFSGDLWDYALGRFGFDVEVFDAQYYDQEPVIETRKIIQAINEELFVDDLAIERNRALVLMFNFVLSEFSAPEWLVKTSLIDVDHRIRDLVPYQNYIQDNQEFVEDYIREVKPYHVKIREFNLKYSGFDQFSGDVADFDVPSYYNTSLQVPQFTSPILLPYNHGTAFNSESNTLSDLPATSAVWETWPYSQWFNNYGMSLDSIDVIDGGTGFTDVPVVNIIGNAIQPAVAQAVINSQGVLVAINIIEPGFGYTSTPTIELEGGNGVGARLYPRLTNSLVRSFRTVIKYDRFQYRSSIVDWQPNQSYPDGTLVRYDNRVWQAASADSVAVVSSTFNLEDWIEINPGSYTYPGSTYNTGLTGVDRTMGVYVPGVNQPGVELPLLIDGVDYPGVQVYGDYFLGSLITDATYESEFTDVTLGTLPTDINVAGGQFIGPYEGHAPEELINGSEYDTLDFRVYTRPGSDWSMNGHGFQIGSVRYEYQPIVTNNYSWKDVVEYPAQILVSNLSTGTTLNVGLDFTIDWVDQTISIVDNVTTGEVININVYEVGGGSQLYRNTYVGNDVGNSVTIPVNAAEIWEVITFVNGVVIDNVTFEPYADSIVWNIVDPYNKFDVVLNESTYYRALQDVPAGIELTNAVYWLEFVPTLDTLVNFPTTYGPNDRLSLFVLGYTTPIQYSWSTPQTQVFVADNLLTFDKTLTLNASLQGTNPANLIVTRNGLRLRPAEDIEWFGDDSSLSFGLPQRGGYQQSLINAPTDIQVWVDNELQVQSVGSIVGSYSVTNWDGSNTPGRQVVFSTPPAAGARILISVTTAAEYNVVGNTVELNTIVNIGDVFQVISWNDTAQQNITTLVFQGPITTGSIIQEPYDSTDYDLATINNTPGSYDYSTGITTASNDLYLGRDSVNASRLWVTLDGYQLFEGEDFVVENGYLILSAGVIGPLQVVAVTEFTDSVVPEQIAFRIFQDMRGVQGVYRITPDTTTTLVQDLAYDADIIYVENAALLSEPNLELGIFGVLTIDGERIMYRERNTALNTISGLRRGTLGTAAADHSTGAYIYDMGRGNLLSQNYQDYVVSDTSIGDGSTSIFYAPSIDLLESPGDSSTEQLALEVYVGGTRQYAYSDNTAESQYRWFVTDFDPVAIQFIVDENAIPPLEAPPADVEVTVLVRRGVSWYQPGVDTASNGQALQETDTDAARFLRGE